MKPVLITLDLAQKMVRPRADDSHKGIHGHGILIAGSSGKMGAAILAAKAALRTGVGLLTVNVPFVEHQLIQLSVPEAMTVGREDTIDYSLYSAIGIGCGLGTGPGTQNILKVVLKQNLPIVIDADALNQLALIPGSLDTLPKNCILTPHPKEFERLFGKTDRREMQEQKAHQMAHKLDCCIVLKGHQTFITDGQTAYRNTSGNSGLAKGGSGDTLTGILCAFLAQGYSTLDAAALGTYLHGLAADIGLKHQSKESLLASDVIDSLGEAFHHIHANKQPL